MMEHDGLHHKTGWALIQTFVEGCRKPVAVDNGEAPLCWGVAYSGPGRHRI